ncbi:hypothetical protein [Agaribacterium haliotis]|uniref:hypothetical protein n=1 Tax=Agaribacterium haliotis TaxID=2013869 RepID=UPI000BB55C90|nr:hypothetical protein [Agaribacterium haliotis]
MGFTRLILKLTVTAAIILMFPLNAVASSVGIISGARFVQDAMPDGDALYIAPPNEHGISVNSFSSFRVDRPLYIMNAPRYESGVEDRINSAEKIIFVVDDTELTSSIRFVGPASDFLVIAQDDSTFSCTNCDISNVLRTSIVASNRPSYAFHSSEIGTIAPGTAKVSLDGLYVPGAVALEIFAMDLDISGIVDVNQDAIKNIDTSRGVYTALEGGPYTMGAGSIDIIKGDFRWHYEDRAIIRALTDNSSSTFSGTLRAPRVSITSAGSLTFNGTIDSRVDAIVVVSYNGQRNSPNPGVTIQTLNSNATLNVQGRVYDETKLTLRSAGDINLDKSMQLNSPNVEIIASKDVNNFADLKAINISIGAGRFVNEASLVADAAIQVYGVSGVLNQYGGLIQAEVIDLESLYGVIRNGSRTPYRDPNPTTSLTELLDLNRSDLLSNFLNPEEEAFKQNSTKLGAFYLMPNTIYVYSQGSHVMAEKNSAHIIGKDVYIRTQAFENINPYYTRVDSQDHILLDRERVSQVGVSAERELSITGSAAGDVLGPATYIINASGYLLQRGDSGQLNLRAHRLVNQRYRVSTYMVEKLGASDDSIAYGSATLIYSPPGFLSSMGGATIKATNYFANMLSYSEFFSGVNIESNVVRSIGLENQMVEQSTTTTTVTHKTIFGSYTTELVDTDTVIKDPVELDALFFVRGNFYAPGSEFRPETYNPFHYFLNEAADYIAGRLRSDQVYVQRTYTKNGTQYAHNHYRTFGGELLYDETINSGELVFKETYTEIDSTVVIPDAIQESKEVTTGETGRTVTHSLFETLTQYYHAVKRHAISAYNEFDWWGLAS